MRFWRDLQRAFALHPNWNYEFMQAATGNKLARIRHHVVVAGMIGIASIVGTDQAHSAPIRLFASQFVNPSSIYSLNPSTGAATAIGNARTFITSMDFRNNGTLYGVNNVLETIDLHTGVATMIAHLPALMGGITFSPNDELFAFSNEAGTLFKLDPATGATLASVQLSGRGSDVISSIEFAPDGTLYGIGGSLYKIEPLTGIVTQITPLTSGIDPKLDFFLDLDCGSDGVLRSITFAQSSENSMLYTINPVTGLGSLVGATGFDIYGLASPIPEPSSLVLAAFGLAGLGAWGWRRRTKAI